jgi:hypothetical protein
MTWLIAVKGALNLAIAASFVKHPPLALFFLGCAIADGGALWIAVRGFG